jgi:hypothetical protein
MDNRDGRREQTHGARTHARTTEQRAEAETGPTAAAKLGIVHGLQVKSTGASPGSANKTQFQGLVSSRGARRCRWRRAFPMPRLISRLFVLHSESESHLGSRQSLLTRSGVS